MGLFCNFLFVCSYEKGCFVFVLSLGFRRTASTINNNRTRCLPPRLFIPPQRESARETPATNGVAAYWGEQPQHDNSARRAPTTHEEATNWGKRPQHRSDREPPTRTSSEGPPSSGNQLYGVGKRQPPTRTAIEKPTGLGKAQWRGSKGEAPATSGELMDWCERPQHNSVPEDPTPTWEHTTGGWGKRLRRSGNRESPTANGKPLCEGNRVRRDGKGEAPTPELGLASVGRRPQHPGFRDSIEQALFGVSLFLRGPTATDKQCEITNRKKHDWLISSRT